MLPDPGEAEEGHDCAEDGPGRHVPGVMLVVSHAASGHYEGVHQGQHLRALEALFIKLSLNIKS